MSLNRPQMVTFVKSRGLLSESALPGDLTPDDLAHDLVGAAVDAVHPGVEERLRDRVLGDVSVTTVQLHAGVENLPLALGRPELDLRGLFARELLVPVRQQSAVEVCPHHVDRGGNVGEPEARVLEV